MTGDAREPLPRPGEHGLRVAANQGASLRHYPPYSWRRSMVVDYDGRLLARPRRSGERIVVAPIDVTALRHEREARTGHAMLAHLRTEAYPVYASTATLRLAPRPGCSRTRAIWPGSARRRPGLDCRHDRGQGRRARRSAGLLVGRGRGRRPRGQRGSYRGAGARAAVPRAAPAVPHGHVGLVWPRSGLAVKHGIDTLAGVIDSDYRGEVRVCWSTTAARPSRSSGDRIAQLLVQPVERAGFTRVEALRERARTGGFGSTGVGAAASDEHVLVVDAVGAALARGAVQAGSCW